MSVPFWKPAREYLKYKAEIDSAILGCLERGEYTLGYYDDGGNEIGNFEKAFAQYVGAKHCVMTGAGTHSLFLAYKALGIGEGDEVIVPSHTFMATIDQIALAGAKPVLVDIDLETGLIDPKEIVAAITDRTKAIVPVHLEGKVCDMEEILRIAKNHRLLIVEDAAQAIGAGTGKKAGTMGDVGCYSFYPAKCLGAPGNAGALVTDSAEVAERARQYRANYGIGKNPDPTSKVDYGTNMEPDAIHAAVLNVKLPHLDTRLKRRKEIAMRYLEELKDTSFILPWDQRGRVWQDFVLRTHSEGQMRWLVRHLKEREIGFLGVGLVPNHAYVSLGLHRHLPKTEEYLATQMRLPCNPDMSDGEVSEVIAALKEFISKPLQ